MATFDWSYGLLSHGEQDALCSLAILVGPFSLGAAAKIIAAEEPLAIDYIAALVSKSLLVTQDQKSKKQYRMLETTRAYAHLRLRTSGEFDKVARLHAGLCFDALVGEEGDLQGRPRTQFAAPDEPSPANIEAALDWALCPTGDAALGIDLAIAAAPMLMRLSMSNEYRRHIDRALAIAITQKEIDPRREMKLYAARGLTLVSTISSGHEVRSAFSKALDIAERINDADYRLRALWGLCNANFNDGDYEAALDIARRFCAFAAASGDSSALGSGEVLLGVSLHLTGRLREGRRCLERLVATEHRSDRSSSNGFLLNYRVLALSVLSAILWHLGFPDQAKQRAEEALVEALSTNHALSICTTLGNCCCFVALYRGDLTEAERLVEILFDYASRHGLDYWKIWGDCFKGVVLIERGQSEDGIVLLQSGFSRLGNKPLDGRFLYLRGHLAEALGQAGAVTEALAIVDEAIESGNIQSQQVVLPMLLRVRGDLCRLIGDAEASERCFRQAIELARQQNSRARELQSALSLVTLWEACGKPADALDLLAGRHATFTEGFDTVDLVSAAGLLGKHNRATRHDPSHRAI